MPHELTSVDEIDTKLLERTYVVYRKGSGDNLKYKFRTKKTLFTIKLTQKEANDVDGTINGSGLPIEIIDV